MRHTFTHFHLVLQVMVARIDGATLRGDWLARESFRPADLPTVMRKAWDIARDTVEARDVLQG